MSARKDAWKQLGTLANAIVDTHLRDLAADPKRADRLRARIGEVTFDLAKQRIDDKVLRALIELARECDLDAAMQRLQSGAIVNETERRPALHTALRAARDELPVAVAADVERERARVGAFVRAVRSGAFTGHTGRTVRDIVHIGIGGSHLGPEFATRALSDHDDGRFRIHFLANVDGHAIERVVRDVDPERALFIVASKTFTTIETRTNAQSARAWLLERGCTVEGLSRHFVAVSSNVDACRAFGIAPENVFPMWDWVGGRYSLWSAVGLPLALAIGSEGFERLLSGARIVDRHVLTAPPERNVPLLLALVGIWNFDFLGAQSLAVLSYDHRLTQLASYLQQLEMESNGKATRRDGTPVDVHTMPVLWGGEETNGQHAFHQQLHQGTRAFAADFVACVNAHHERDEHHRRLLANCLAQSEAMLKGRQLDELGNDPLATHKVVPGNHASTTILLDALTPAALGTLLAVYEHKVFYQGMIWQVNPFDQWGVELGKALGETIERELVSDAVVPHDPSTRALIQQIKRDRRSHR
jgi:glucose-6-phosphate isomerase